MPVLRLRNHIPISGPATREPTTGDEPPMRVSLGFEPGWYKDRCGVTFDERWHKDPIHRYESLRLKKSGLLRCFPKAEYWDPVNDDDLATISGCYGAMAVPAAFGLRIRYSEDGWPDLEPGQELTPEQISQLSADKALSSPFMEELMGQVQIIRFRRGKVHGYMNWQGVLNNALRLRGYGLLMDLYDRPDLVHHLFSVITEAMIAMASRVQAAQRESGFPINLMTISNCTVNMVSPEAYREFIKAYDTKLAMEFERFGVHTCNWNITPYLDVLAELPNVGYIDMGMMSDMALARATFPEARRAVLYSPVRLAEESPEVIKADLDRIYYELSPCDIVFADIGRECPDWKVIQAIEFCRSYS